jgi:cohesin loading factor subunit SCC2
MREGSFTPKFIRLFEALKAGRKATFKKFISNICKHADFDLSKLDVSGDMPDPVLFARFCLENIAVLDFPHLDELAVCLNAIEAIVLKTTGPIVALAIETEMPKHFVAAELPLAPDMPQQQLDDTVGAEVSFASFMDAVPTTSQLAQPKIDDNRLRQLTVACMILLMVWETRSFIRRCYSLSKLVGRIPQKEYAKPAQRNNFVSGKDLWERLTPVMSALDSREAMVKTCYDFAELLDVDREAQIGDDADEDALGTGYETPVEGIDDTAVTFPTSGRGRKRKSNANLGNTPKKPRGRPAKNKKRASRTPDGDDDSD